MSRREWFDRASSPGHRERSRDRNHRWRAERARARLDRDNLEAHSEEADVVVPTGSTVRPAPPVTELSGLLAALVEERGWGERLRGAGLAERWDEVVGEQLAQRSRPGRLAGGVLQVIVDSPAWATQVRYLTAQIAGRATAVGGAEVREVTVVVGD